MLRLIISLKNIVFFRIFNKISSRSFRKIFSRNILSIRCINKFFFSLNSRFYYINQVQDYPIVGYSWIDTVCLVTFYHSANSSCIWIGFSLHNSFNSSNFFDAPERSLSSKLKFFFFKSLIPLFACSVRYKIVLFQWRTNHFSILNS